MIIQRIRQLWAALQAEISEADRRYIADNLTPELQKLFFAMSKGDQAHALQVAYTAERLASEVADNTDLALLRRCALLHDIGRGYEAGTPWAKTLAVLVKAIRAEACQDDEDAYLQQAGYLQRIMYRHRKHPLLGAEMLRERGYFAEAEIIAGHHRAAKKDDALELQLLRRADEMN